MLLSGPVDSNGKSEDSPNKIPPVEIFGINQEFSEEPCTENAQRLLEGKDAVDLTGMGAFTDVVASTDVSELTSKSKTETKVGKGTKPEVGIEPIFSN